jgi:hypothetical protein
MYGRRLGRPQAPVAEGGPIGFSDGGNRRDWFPGPGGYGRPKRRPNGDVILIIALILVLYFRPSTLSIAAKRRESLLDDLWGPSP